MRWHTTIVLTLALLVGGCAHSQVITLLTSQGTFLKHYERPGGDEIYIVRTPDGHITKYRVYPQKSSPIQIFPQYRYERLYTIDNMSGLCRAGVEAVVIDCSKLKADPDLREYIE